ncbi:dihydropyrimidinase [Desulfosporosinus sp. PR]|uniref:dihydropyrimidinase n=1 Tax=Candidatus Desulfosporosinus nitrosoreducens TaxID=3401928 RepID=UPI0027F9C068|nr:dihydropyrimidinase [Desulfosporosinus sp. PR]MDQ7094376.1 dihydropyrimidinase [Desulfosporosinus sp. PR]
MTTVLIKNGRITTSSDQFKGDLWIEDDKIVLVGSKIIEKADVIIDATDKWVFPGGIDAHVHMDVPCSDGSLSAGYDTETIAAARGGTTTMLDYVLQEKGQLLQKTITDWKSKAARSSAIDYGFHVIVTEPNETTIRDIEKLAKDGITSFKLFMANDIALRDKDLLRFMEELKRQGCNACIHAENKDMIDYLQEKTILNGNVEPYYHPKSRPAITEAEAIQRALALAELTGCPTLIAHISTEQGRKLVGAAKAKGLEVYGESCPHYLLLTNENYQKDSYESAKFVLSPPLRSEENRQGLWQGVLGTDIDIISSDHNGFSYSTHKQLGRQDYRKIPNGAPGIEHRYMLMYHFCQERGIELSRFVELVATNPAKIFGLYPQKGTLAPGSDADIVIVDPKVEQVISANNQCQKSDYTPYEGFNLMGKVESVLLRGQLIVEKGKFIGQAGMGKFLKRAAKKA